MFEVIYIKADYEPWWMFEGWEEMIRRRQSFSEASAARAYFEELRAELRSKHDYEATKKECFFAFWTQGELSFCEGCDEDLQLYHGVILMKDGEPSTF
ncbi:DUF1033 family protein [Sporosarcina sp. ACRSM]|uniref:DUF1033 family protein n=1 Tax=Sporosarcina sp. ACRSM TaxID=2918216 RepID=UPI001EF67956|nr:DUF1033 family protein [Sporosarcina sp. ACRSM]MCG7334494.1 DUF1033 family protein [Sporosarcina sp. ACRSM]